MAALINEFSGLPMDFQNLMSCIQCHEEEKNTVVIVETMKTIASICSEEEFGKNAFRDVGGLDFLLEFITNTDQVAILEYGLKVLAFVVDGNVHNQMHLTNQRTFTVLQAIFKKKECPISIVKNAVVLFSTILYQNRSAQDLLQEDTYLQTLMIQYRHYAPTYTGHNEQEDPYCLDIWLNISSTLCFAVNNPLNGENQRMCSVLFPLSLRIIETSTNPLVVKASSSFLSLCIASNAKNQDSFAENEGFLILKCLLNKNFEILKSYMKECNNVVRKTTLGTIIALIGIISAAVLDHEKNAVLCGKLGIVSQMIELLSIEVLSYSCKKSLILALGYSIDAYSDNRFIALDVPQFDSLLKSNLKEADQELHSTAKYLLQVCLKKHGNECFIEGTALGKVTEYSNQSSFLKSSNKRSEDSLSPHKDTQQMSAQLQQRNFQKYIYHHRGSNESSKTLSQHYENRASCRNTDELSCLSGKFMLQGTEIAKNLDTSASNLFLLNSKPVNYQEKTDKYAYKSSNEEDESSECDSLSRISLQSAGHLFRLNKERMKQSVKNKSREACSFSKNGDYYVSSVIGNSGASENADANSMSKKNTKKQIKDEFLDRKKYIDRLFRNEPEGFSKPYSTSQRKRGLISGNPKTGESKKTQNGMPGCLKVIVLPGTRCPEHKLAAHFEMLKLRNSW